MVHTVKRIQQWQKILLMVAKQLGCKAFEYLQVAAAGEQG